jgi:hypothetical protein
MEGPLSEVVDGVDAKGAFRRPDGVADGLANQLRTAFRNDIDVGRFATA